jgi:tripeptidyl-peptidase-1
MQVATPGHALYGQHMSHEEIIAMVAPAKESADFVMQWLESELSHLSTKVSQKGDYVTVEASVAEIEQLLDAKYSVFGTFAPKCNKRYSDHDSEL